eukprot:scaffold16627_cov93-Cyclotella_meneghiniana.AAC.1
MKCTAHHICQGQLAFSILVMVLTDSDKRYYKSSSRLPLQTKLECELWWSFRKCFKIPKKRSYGYQVISFLHPAQKKQFPGTVHFLQFPKWGTQDTRPAAPNIGNDKGDR